MLVKFCEAYQSLKDFGAKTIPFQTSGAKFVDVWASELISGPRKGESIIRIQWANSSSTIDEADWDQPKSSLMKHLRYAIVEAIS